jgi:hypothetical protein
MLFEVYKDLRCVFDGVSQTYPYFSSRSITWLRSFIEESSWEFKRSSG